MNEEEYNEAILNNPKLRNFIDFSKFPKDHILYNNNNTECGKMKSERGGRIINYTPALKSKMYYLDYDIKPSSTLKGITRAVKKNYVQVNII